MLTNKLNAVIHALTPATVGVLALALGASFLGGLGLILNVKEKSMRTIALTGLVSLIGAMVAFMWPHYHLSFCAV